LHASELPAMCAHSNKVELLKVAPIEDLSSCVTVIHAANLNQCSTVSTAISTIPQDDSEPSIGRRLDRWTWVTKLTEIPRHKDSSAYVI
jgi:hypothetical protein